MNITRTISTILALLALAAAAPAQQAPEGATPVPTASPAASAIEEPATKVPVLLAPVDRWREDPQIALVARDIALEDFKWTARPVVIFAETPADPAFQRQMELLGGRMEDLVRRDVVVITDTDPAAMSPLRRKLRPRGFMMVLIGKDGEIELRKPGPYDVREIVRTIDKMPLRKQELNEQRNANQ